MSDATEAPNGTEAPAADAAPADPAPPQGTILGSATADTPAGDDPTPAAADPAEGSVDPEPKVDEPAAIDPASYEFTAPEGMTLDPETLVPFRALSAELNLDNPKAQKLLDLHTTQLAAMQKAQGEAFAATQTAWRAEVEALPEFTGSEGPKTLAAIGRVMDEYGSPEVKEILNATGAGNNPHVVKMFTKLAKALGEGAPAPQGNPKLNGEAKTPGQVLYPNQPV